ncbi:MAG: peptide ABC transporter substrate-binding protein [Oscillospiraceae bacterium]|nr:peptide ABC transporter substrate-binding protein [Oscillospiraceae bacterium]
MKRICSIALVIAILCTLLSSCKKSSKKEGPGTGSSISYSLVTEPQNLDPQTSNDAGSALLIRNIFEGLVRADEYGNAKPGVAESWENNENYTSYTFHLRSNALWSDGTPVTSKDFLFAWRRAIMPVTSAANVAQFFCIKNAQDINEGKKGIDTLGVQAPDDYTLKVELNYPFSDFPIHISQIPFMPCNEAFFSTTKGKYGLDDNMVLSNGPYYMNDKSWVHDERIRIHYNKNYNGPQGKAYPKSVLFVIRKPGTDYYTLISSGTVDAAAIPAAQAEQALNSNLTCIKYADTTWGLVFNTGAGVLSNLKIRQSFVRSIDSTAYEAGIPKYTEMAYDIIPPATRLNGKLYRELAGSGYKVKFDAKTARLSYDSGLIELGRLELPKVTVLCPDDNNSKYMMQGLIQCWQDALACYINLQVLPMEEIKTRILTGDYQMALYPLAPTRDGPLNCLNTFRSSAYYNPSKFKHTAYDLLLDQAASASATDTAINNIIAAEKYLNDYAAFYPMYYESKYYLIQKKVSGISFAPFDGVADFSKARKEAS